MDVIVAAEKRAIEVKAQHVLAKKYACRMEKDALADKIAYGKKMGYKLETRLIIVDDSTPDHIMAVYKRNGVGNFDVQSMEFIGSYDKFGKPLGIKFDKYGKRIGDEVIVKPWVPPPELQPRKSDVLALPDIPISINRPRGSFTDYDIALGDVSEGGTLQTKKNLVEAIANEPERVRELQQEIRSRQGEKVRLYRATRGRELSVIESFTDDPAIAKSIGADIVVDVPVEAIIGYAKYQPNALRRGLFTESEVMVDISKLKWRGNFDVQSMEFVGSYDKFGKTLGIKFDKYGKRVGEATTSIKLKEAIEGYFGSSIGSNSLREGWSVLAEGGTKKFAMQKISASLDKSGAIMSAAARKKEMDLFSNVDIFNEFKSKINGAKASEKVLFRKTNGFLSTKVGDVVKFNTPQSFTSDAEYLKEFKGGTILIIEPGAPAVSVDSILGMTDSLEDLLMGSFRVVDVQAKGSKRTIRMVYEKG